MFFQGYPGPRFTAIQLKVRLDNPLGPLRIGIIFFLYADLSAYAH